MRYFDPYIEFLKDTGRFLDRELSKIERDARRSEDPDMFGQYDSAEYVTGLGFVACQQYMTCISRGKKQVDRGPKHSCGKTFAALVNAAANHWKHSTEWDASKVDTRAERAKQTLKRLGLDLDQSYVLANALYKMLQPHPNRFTQLIPYLERWRDDLFGGPPL